MMYLIRENYVEGRISETVDGTYIITVNGIQWGPPGTPRDMSGCADTEYSSPRAALKGFANAYGVPANLFTLEKE